MPKPQPHHCGYCGVDWWKTAEPELIPYPKMCDGCGNVTYRNPLPVVIGLIPVVEERGKVGLLLVQRKDSHEFAFPGGFMECADTSWEEALNREVLQETGLDLTEKKCREDDWKLMGVKTATNGNLLVFASLGITTNRRADKFENGPPENLETESLSIAYDASVKLAFVSHAQALDCWFHTFGQNVFVTGPYFSLYERPTF
jgi:8-oxo-dGTP pyrophosphatase MutT (NUDIX family)